MSDKRPDTSSREYDPVYLHTRRETVFIIGAWIMLCLWVVGISLLTGYDVDPDELSTVLGMPSWVFWGVGLPWIAANIFIIWFCLKYMVDDPLGEDEEEKPSDSASITGGGVERE